MYRHISLICKIAFVRSPKRKQCRIWCSFYDWRLMNWLLIKTDINSHFALGLLCHQLMIMLNADNAVQCNQAMLDLLTVGPKFTRPACRMQTTMRIARRSTTLLLPRALPLGQTDGQTNGRTDGRTQQRFKTLKACAIRVITDKSFCKKVVHTRSPSVGFRRWSRFLAVSLKVTWVINPAIGCHYFPPGL